MNFFYLVIDTWEKFSFSYDRGHFVLHNFNPKALLSFFRVSIIKRTSIIGCVALYFKIIIKKIFLAEDDHEIGNSKDTELLSQIYIRLIIQHIRN